MFRRFIVVCLALFLLNGLVATSAMADAVVAKGLRELAVKVNIDRRADFDAAFKEAEDVGSETQVVAFDWRDMEPEAGHFEPEVNYLAIANFYYPPRKIPVHLVIRPIHNNQNVMPYDLVHKKLDDPAVIERFKRLLDWAALQIPRLQVRSLCIGSEIDMFMQGDAQRWDEWIRFYAEVGDYARMLFPTTLITSETTAAALLGPDLKNVQTMHAHSDAVGVAYYPMQAQRGAVKVPAPVHDDFERMTRAMDGKKLLFYQIGYPSSRILGSSPIKQAEFIDHAFQAWDDHADQIAMLNFQWMHDVIDAELDAFAVYFDKDTPAFRAFLGSLGLKSWEGQAKPAWHRLKEEAARRGFGR